MQDYFLPKKVMSWKEAFELYLERQMLDGLFPDLEYYGITPPRHVEQAITEKEYMSHQVFWILYQFSHAAAFTTTIPHDEEMDWMAEQYPETFNQHYRPMYLKAREMQQQGTAVLQRWPAHAVPGLPDPDGLHRTRQSRSAVAAAQPLRG